MVSDEVRLNILAAGLAGFIQPIIFNPFGFAPRPMASGRRGCLHV